MPDTSPRVAVVTGGARGIGLAIACDVSDPQLVSKAFAQAAQRFGRVDARPGPRAPATPRASTGPAWTGSSARLRSSLRLHGFQSPPSCSRFGCRRSTWYFTSAATRYTACANLP